MSAIKEMIFVWCRLCCDYVCWRDCIQIIRRGIEEGTGMSIRGKTSRARLRTTICDPTYLCGKAFGFKISVVIVAGISG